MFRTDVFRVALAEAGKTQKQVAAEAGINPNSFTRIKGGADTPVSIALKIARAVNRRVEELWSLDE